MNMILGFIQSNALNILGFLFSILGLWKIAEFLYNNYLKTVIKDGALWATGWAYPKGIKVGKFWAQKIKSKGLIIQMTLDLYSNIEKIFNSFVRGVIVGTGLENEPEIKELMGKLQ